MDIMLVIFAPNSDSYFWEVRCICFFACAHAAAVLRFSVILTPGGWSLENIPQV